MSHHPVKVWRVIYRGVWKSTLYNPTRAVLPSLPNKALMQASVSEWIKLDKHLVLTSTSVRVPRQAIHNCSVSFRSAIIRIRLQRVPLLQILRVTCGNVGSPCIFGRYFAQQLQRPSADCGRPRNRILGNKVDQCGMNFRYYQLIGFNRLGHFSRFNFRLNIETTTIKNWGLPNWTRTSIDSM